MRVISESEVREAVEAWIYNVWNDKVDSATLMAVVCDGKFDGYVVEVDNGSEVGLPE